MKKIILLCALLCTFFAFAQYPEKDPVLLKGHKIKIKERTPEQVKRLAKYGMDAYDDFYADKANKTIYKDKNHKTPNAALNGREFNVTDVTVNDSFDLELFGKQYWFTLTDGTETLYYMRFEKSHDAIPFTVVDITYAPEYWDKYIKADTTRKLFKAEKDKVFMVDKFIDAKGKATYAVSLLTSYGPKDCETEKGIQFIFDDGDVLKLPNAVIGELKGGGGYLCTQTVDEASFKKLGEKNVVQVKWCATETPFLYTEIFKNVMLRLYGTK